MDIQLKPGDVFASKNPQGLGRAILIAQSYKSADEAAEYGHTGIITSSYGNTVEAVWSIKEQNLFDAYKGMKVLVARWQGMDDVAYKCGYNAIKKNIGRVYPWYRLVWHLLGLARWFHVFKTPVCSELTAMFLIGAGAVTLEGTEPWGATPDSLVDEWRISKYFDILWEGKL